MKMILKKSMLRKHKLSLLALIVALGIASCSDDDSSGEETARLTVRMTDAPGDYEAVFVDVEDVRIKAESDGDDEEGWVSIGNVNTGVYNLLELTGGIDVLLADNDVPARYLSQIRLVLGNNNSVVVDGEIQALSAPSAEQSGLKLQVNQELEAGEEYYFLLDFDVAESIVSAGNLGGLLLKPVIRISTQAESGVIMGSVHPYENFKSLVKATNASHSISAYTDAQGDFVLHGVPGGTYKITVTPAEASGLEPVEIDNVEVESDSRVELGTIYLE